MKAPQTIKKMDAFTTRVLDSDKEGEFTIELFPYTPEMDCVGKPIKTIKNFDELIKFFEEEEF